MAPRISEEFWANKLQSQKKKKEKNMLFSDTRYQVG